MSVKSRYRIADNLSRAMIGNVAAAVRGMEFHIHLLEQMIEARKCSGLPLRPSVITCGCSQRSSTSGMRARLARLHEPALQFERRFVADRARDRQPSTSFITCWQPQFTCAKLVDREAADGVERIAHRFPNRWMRVNHGIHIIERGFETERRSRLRDNLRGERPDHMHAQNLAIFCFGNYFDEAFMQAENRRLAISDEREFASLHCKPGLTRLLFGEADRADLRFAICGVRAALAVKRLHLFSRHAPDRNDSFHRSGMRELRQSRDNIANGVEIRLIRFQKRIRVNIAALELRLRFFEPEIFGDAGGGRRQSKLFLR